VAATRKAFCVPDALLLLSLLAEELILMFINKRARRNSKSAPKLFCYASVVTFHFNGIRDLGLGRPDRRVLQVCAA
jgi:hypothetical protein